MKRYFAFIISALIILTATPVLSLSQGPLAGDLLPELILKVPQDPALRAYLGLDGKKIFSIPDIQAEVVVIEIFSMY